MKLILCSDGDTSAAWAYTNLISLGCEDLELVTSGDLAHATQWSHRVKSDGSSVDIHLRDGRRISLESLDGVINRLNWPSRALIGQATEEDQDYAWAESFAFISAGFIRYPESYLTGQHRKGFADHSGLPPNGPCLLAARDFTSNHSPSPLRPGSVLRKKEEHYPESYCSKEDPSVY